MIRMCCRRASMRLRFIAVGSGLEVLEDASRAIFKKMC